MSTFSGHVSEIIGISIDRFDGDNLKSVAYFLSHCHTDHMEGLQKKSFIDRLTENPHINLYYSEITSLILKSSGLSAVSDQIIGLPIGDISLLDIKREDDTVAVNLTLMPAGHCPGSVMFLFEGDCGVILYTGDFRISSKDIKSLKPFYDPYGNIKPINKLYLDTTFVGLYGTIGEEFPTRKESADEVIRLITQWLSQGNEHCINLFTSARYGSEYLLTEIATKLKTQIHVPDINYKVYSAIPEIAWAVTNDPHVQIQAYGKAEKDSRLQPDFKRELNGIQVEEQNVRTIKPAALWWCNKYYKYLSISSQFEGEFFRVMYSCHASPHEIQALLHFLRPHMIEPCVIPQDFTRQKVASICYTMVEELRPIPSLLPCSPPSYTMEDESVVGSLLTEDEEMDVVASGSGVDQDFENLQTSPPQYDDYIAKGRKRKRE